uniref:delta(9) fatty acid conjugase-like enzyme n=1 Tax=Erigeron canadensis TaxID=72917 RepID=UPI001CB8C836|nr:delta(9) fatty acid conjugase-like enzyme [Erigeron canadensis]
MGEADEMKLLERVPISKPPFELSDLKKAIPPHCFKLSLIRSFASLFQDIFIISSLYYIASNYIPLLPHSVSYIVWPLYWSFQGIILGSIWTIGHECGHRAFSGYPWLDDIVGFLVHSFVLTPYFSFKYSHRAHHSHTNSMEYDTVHVPYKRRSDTFKILDNPIGVTLMIMFKILVGLPSYYLFNHSGRKYDQGLGSHVYPKSPMFKNKERGQIYVSDVGILIVLYAYYHVVQTKGMIWAFYVYGAPWILHSGTVFAITYLNHNHPSIPHYDSTEWDWIRGALSTVDRDLGFLNMLVHDVPRNHVVHHLFPSIPHYHSYEATQALKPILGDYYKCDATFLFKAIWRDIHKCIFVESDDVGKKYGIYWSKSKT